MLKIYGIKSCDTCRRARKFLDERDIEYTFHDVRDDGVNIQMLERWADRVSWERLLNRKSLTWRKIPEVDRNDINREKALAAMLDNPTLIKRPVFEHDDYMAVGFSEKRFGDFLERTAR
ncbi:MAG: arsenate reductase [Woeseiaceae bacterium]|nr:arsenate reductase [Woeseiaceae bacterium]